MEAVNIGIIGCGSIATTAHIPAIEKLAGMVRLVASADVNRETAEAVAPHRRYQEKAVFKAT